MAPTKGMTKRKLQNLVKKVATAKADAKSLQDAAHVAKAKFMTTVGIVDGVIGGATVTLSDYFKCKAAADKAINTEYLEYIKATQKFQKSLAAYGLIVTDAEAALAMYNAQQSAQAATASNPAAAASSAPSPLTPYEFPTDKEFDPNGVKVLNANIGGSTGAKLVEIDGHKYIMKTDTRVSKEHILNEAAADQMYRAAGIRVPDCKTYQVGGKTYKLAEFLEGGETLGDYLSHAGAAEKERVKQELLKGFQIDVALANWDVLGTGKDNVLIDKHGNVWRIDNGSAMGFRAQGTAKAADKWAKADFPDEWRTMRIPEPGRSNINDGIFDASVTAHDIFSKQVDWDAVLAATPKSEYARVERRVNELKQMSARCADFDNGGYMPEATNVVLETSYDLSKEGFREFCPKHVSRGNYGSCRSGNGNSNIQLPPEPIKPVQPIQTSGNWNGKKFSVALTDAAKSINYHIAQGDFKANTSTISSALALESELKVLAQTDKQAQELLDKLNDIKVSQSNGFKDKIGMVHTYDLPQSPATIKALQAQFKVDQAQYQTALAQYQADHAAWQTKCNQIKASAGISMYKSLTDQVHQKINSEGGDAQFIIDAQSSQAGSSWGSTACRLKVVELSMRGIKSFDEAEKAGMFCGTPGQRKQLKSAFDYYKKNSSKLTQDTKSLAIHKAAVCEFLENTNADNIDHKERTIITVRTEDNIPGVAGAMPNSEVVYKIACSESTAHGSITVVCGRNTVVTKVPFSRVMGCYWWERNPGCNNSSYMGDNEQEIVCDTFGSHYKKVFVGEARYGTKLSEDKKGYDEAVRRYKDFISKYGDKI